LLDLVESFEQFGKFYIRQDTAVIRVAGRYPRPRNTRVRLGGSHVANFRRFLVGSKRGRLGDRRIAPTGQSDAPFAHFIYKTFHIVPPESESMISSYTG
jgi:hypothetical protein